MFSFREKLVVALLLVMMTVSFGFWVWHIYTSVTNAVPKKGGEYVEGIVGQPLYVNPLLSQTSVADSDLSQLVYDSLFTYDDNGVITPDLAESFEISEDQKTYTVHLRSGILWHDGEQLAADDVVFTMNILQDPAYKSPLRQNWQGVEVRKTDEKTVEFILKNPYFGFLDNLTVGILPKHIWENIAPEKFALAEYNLHPIGSGPYMFSDFQKDASGNILTYKLTAFKSYHDREPYISKFTFNFYGDDDAMIAAYNKKEIMGISSISPEKLDSIKTKKSMYLHEFVIPRYFALFMNQSKSAALADDVVRKALVLSTNRKEIIDTVLRGKGTTLNSPVFPQMSGYKESSDAQVFDTDRANALLEENGWKKSDDGIRTKNDTRLAFEIVSTEWPELIQNAQLLKTQWEKIGAEVSVKVFPVADLQQNYIRTREYDSMLFGQAISFNPDLYSFWHSSQKRDPGLNLALFDNKDADKLLDEIRTELNPDARNEKYAQLQDLFYQENPAIFLYSPNYLYPLNGAVKGIEIKNINVPSQRFIDVNKWYIKTKRVFK